MGSGVDHHRDEASPEFICVYNHTHNKLFSVHTLELQPSVVVVEGRRGVGGVNKTGVKKRRISFSLHSLTHGFSTVLQKKKKKKQKKENHSNNVLVL